MHAVPFDGPFAESRTLQGPGATGYVLPGNQILTSAQGLEWAARILVRATPDAPPQEAQVSHLDGDQDLAVLTVEDPEFFVGLEPLDRGTLLSLVSGSDPTTGSGEWGGGDPGENLPEGETTDLARGSLALRTWAKTREDRATGSQGAGSLLYAAQEAPAGAIGLMAAPAPLTLADFNRANEAARFTRSNVNVAVVKNEGGSALRLTAATPTADSTLVLNNPTGWNLSGHGELTLFIKNNGPVPVTNTWSLVNAAGRQVSLQTFLAPGSMRTLRIPLVPATYTPAYTTSALRGIPKATLLNNMAMDLTRVIRFQVTGRLGTSTLEIGNLVAKESPMPLQNPFPLVDDFGQYRFLGWDGKVTGVGDLTAQRDRERAELASNPRPANWNEYGGWTGGPQLTATGHFRTEKYQGRWYFVDPAGRLFFSMAIKDVNDRQDTALNSRRHMFPALPTISPDPEAIFSVQRTTLPSYYLAGAAAETFSYFKYNLLRKYGADWKNQFIAATHPRLRNWGFNTMAGTTEPRFVRDRRFPYAMLAETSFSVTIPGTGIGWGPFPDVWHSQFTDQLALRLDTWATWSYAKTDPWCIGIFVDNELPWSDVEWRDNEVALGALTAPATQPAKVAFINQLRAKYLTVVALNLVWKTTFTSWDAMLATSIKLTATQITGARPDLNEFYARTCDTYFRKVSAVIRAKAPRKLYLGTKIARMSATALRTASRYADVHTLNFYGKTPVALFSRILPGNQLFRDCLGDKPVFFGEFSFAPMDRGLIYNNHYEAIDTEDRAQLYRNYVFDALKDPAVVGVTYFQFVDQMVTGRPFDGEGRISGLLDVADQPHRHFVATSRRLSDSMYAIRSGAITAIPPLVASRPDMAAPPVTQTRIVAAPQENGQVNLTVLNPPATAVRYNWSIIAAPAGAKAGVVTGTGASATVVQYLSGTYRYQVGFLNSAGASVGTPVASDPVALNITADLAPVSIVPVIAKPGEAVTFSAIIRNIGAAATLRTQTSATFQLLPRAGGAAVFSGWGVPLASVAPGADLTIVSTSGGAAGNGVWTAVRGEYTLRLQVDDADRVPESSAANNVLRINVDVVDSIPTIPEPEITVTPRGDGTATFTLKNPPAGTGLIYDWSVISAPAGAKALTFASRAQTTTAVHFLSGRYQYGVIIRNSLGAILGTQVLSDPVDILITADLKPVSSATLRAKTGERVGFGAILQNAGASAALYGQTAATFELVPKAGGARIPVGFGVQVVALGAGASISVPATHGGPLGTGQWIAVKGEYTLRVTADDIDRIPEANNANNVYTVDFSVTD